MGIGDEDIRRERDEPAEDVREPDRRRARERAARHRRIEAELEAHHEIDPRFGPPLERGDQGRDLVLRHPVSLEDLLDLGGLDLGDGADLVHLARTLAPVVIGVAARSEVAAEPHRDRAGGDLGDAGGEDEARPRDRAGEPRREREGHRQPVGHPDHDVANERASPKVGLDMRMRRHGDTT